MGNQPSALSSEPRPRYSPATCSPRTQISPRAPGSTALPSSSRTVSSIEGNGLPTEVSRRRTDWSLLERHADVHRFVKLLLTARMQRDVVIDQRRMSLNDLLRESRIAFLPPGADIAPGAAETFEAIVPVGTDFTPGQTWPFHS